MANRNTKAKRKLAAKAAKTGGKKVVSQNTKRGTQQVIIEGTTYHIAIDPNRGARFKPAVANRGKKKERAPRETAAE